MGVCLWQKTKYGTILVLESDTGTSSLTPISSSAAFQCQQLLRFVHINITEGFIIGQGVRVHEGSFTHMEINHIAQHHQLKMEMMSKVLLMGPRMVVECTWLGTSEGSKFLHKAGRWVEVDSNSVGFLVAVHR